MKFIFLVCFLLIGCATRTRTEYKPMGEDGGFKDQSSGAVRTVSFKGNELTKKDTAELFATFRAIEICEENSSKFAYILGSSDKSSTKEILRTSSAGYPYSFGVSPYSSRYSSFGMGFGTLSGQAWKETKVYPEIEVTFICTNQIMGPDMTVREVSAEEMKLLVKDFKGGLQVEAIPETSPNLKLIEVGDVILKANDVRIEKTAQFLQAFLNTKKIVALEIMREGVRKKIMAKSRDLSEVIQLSQTELVKMACTEKEMKNRLSCKTN